MQNRYAGDVGDYVKFGLLRALTGADDEPALSLGVMWYLTADEDHNQDGKHISYLEDGSRWARRLAPCDPDLYRCLQRVVAGGTRSVDALKGAGALPVGTASYAALVSSDRTSWLEAGLRRTAGCDVVFFDPDNGLTTPARDPIGSRHAAKYAYPEELARFAQRDQSLVVYQHTDRSAPVIEQARRRLQELSDATHRVPWGALRCLRGTSRLFLIAPADRHRAIISRRLRRFGEEPWSRACSLISANS